MQVTRLTASWLAATLLIFANLATAGDPAEIAPENGLFDSIWQSAKLYQNADAPVLQSFSLIGRYHGQQWWVDADQGQASGWENRRFIFGFSARLYRQFRLQAQIHVSDDLRRPYDGLYEAYIRWQSEEIDLAFRIGRLDYVYTGLERSTSSNQIVTIERSQLVNQLMPGEVVGVLARGSAGELKYQAGLFSGTIGDEFSDFSAGYTAMLGASYNSPLGFDEGRLHLDYLYNNGDPDNDAFEPYRHIIALWHQGTAGRFGLQSDLTVGRGLDGVSNVFGITLIPTYDLARGVVSDGDRLQLALRLHYASSEDDNGLLPQRRYEQKVTSDSGDRYRAFYAGINYYPYEKFKLMFGAEFSDLEDSAEDRSALRGWNYFAGVRLYF